MMFMGYEDEDWYHILTCQGTGAIIFNTGSWAQLRTSMNKWKIHQDIWKDFENGLHHFSRLPLNYDRSQPAPSFGPSLRACHVLLNNATAKQTRIGWHNFLKGRISIEWAKLWIKAMGSKMVRTCECVLSKALWDHIYRLWIFGNNEDHKNENRTVAQYKQQALDIKITQQCDTFNTCDLPLNPLRHHFDIPQDQLILLYHDIRCAWLRSADLYISRATAHNDLARGSHAQHILRHTIGRPPGALA
jgi:hypothetical protein